MNILPSKTLGRRIALVVLLFAVPLATAVIAWGTSWSITAAGAGTGSYTLVASWDGSDAPSGAFQRPIGIAVAPNGDVFVTDARNRVVQLDRNGEVKGEWGDEGDGPGQFSNPIGVAVAPSDGSVYVSDFFQDRVQKFTREGDFVLAFGSSGSAPGEFDAPAGVAVDDRGYIYVTDFYNDRVQQFSEDGTFERVVGHAGRVGGGALHYPTGIDVTPDGRVLVADAYNYQLQWFDEDAVPLKRLGYHVLWLWPRPVASAAGFNVPTDVAVSQSGQIHVADSGNHRVLMLSERGERLGSWVLPDAGPDVYSPEHIAVSPDGATVYATDLALDRVLVLAVTLNRPAGR